MDVGDKVMNAERREYETARAALLKENAYPSDFEIWLLARRTPSLPQLGDKVNDERAEFEVWALNMGWEALIIEKRNGEGYAEPFLADYWLCWQMARRTPSASIGEDGLPELPEAYTPAHESEGCHWPDVFTDNQMLQYAREAVSADRRARETRGKIDTGFFVEEFDAAAKAMREDAPTWADVQARERDIRELQSQVIELRAQLASQGEPVVYVNRKELDDAHANGGGLLTSEPKSGRYFDVPLYAAPPLSSEPQGEN